MDPTSNRSQGSAGPATDAQNAIRPRASRAPLVHAVMCRFAGEADFVEVTTLNISQSGMLIEGAILPTVGSALDFKFLLETGFEILSGTGAVMRHAAGPGGRPAAGIAFAELDPAKQRILARVIELHSESEQ